MNIENFNKMLLESVGVGLAILKRDTREVVFGNRRFVEWFPGTVGVGTCLENLFPGVDQRQVESRLADGKTFACEAQIKIKRRPMTLALHFTRHVYNDMSVMILECTNITKIKELEYMIESYSKMIEKQNRTLAARKGAGRETAAQRHAAKSIYDELKTFGVTDTAESTRPRRSSCSISSASQDMAISQDPAGLIIAELNDIFTAFDRIAEQFGCERIKTIGDAYMAVSGIPEHSPEHAHNIAKVALLILRYLQRRNTAHSNEWICRIGINSGTLIGSIVGVQKYVYDIFGPAVNLAARLEALSEPMQITLCEDMHDLIRHEFSFTDRGETEIKGFGTRRIFSLDGAQAPLAPQSPYLG